MRRFAEAKNAVPDHENKKAQQPTLSAHESAIRRMRADAHSKPYRAFRSLVETRSAHDGVVVVSPDIKVELEDVLVLDVPPIRG